MTSGGSIEGRERWSNEGRGVFLTEGDTAGLNTSPCEEQVVVGDPFRPGLILAVPTIVRWGSALREKSSEKIVKFKQREVSLIWASK